MKNNIPNLKKFEEFQLRHAAIAEANNIITKKTETQNEKFDKLWDGFIALGYVDPDEISEVIPILKDEFEPLLNEERTELDRFLNLIENKKRTDLIKACEQHVIKIYQLIQRRWMTLLQFQDFRREDLINLRSKQSNFIPNLEIIESNLQKLKLNDNELQKMFQEIQHQIKEEETILLKLENSAKELNYLLEIREYLFNVSQDLFLK